MGVAVDNAGNLFIADYINDRVRKVGTNGIITTVAGNGKQDYSGDGSAATNAALFYPSSVAVDSAGNLFIADGERIRKVGTDGIIITVAGMDDGPVGYSGDGGAATNAELYSPSGVALDSACNLFIADVNNQRIRKVWMNSSIPSLTLTNISDPSGGNYQVIVYGNGGSVTSSVSTLTIAYPPSIVTQPTNQIVIIGSNAVFSVSASGVSLSYHWRSNSVNILNATNSALTLNSIQTNAAASYSVNVTNIAGGVTSSNATLTVVMARYTQISSPVLVNGKMSLSFVGIAGGNYALDRSFSLSPANWIPQITNLADANGNLTFTNTPDSTTNNFWRIRSVQ